MYAGQRSKVDFVVSVRAIHDRLPAPLVPCGWCALYAMLEQHKPTSSPACSANAASIAVTSSFRSGQSNPFPVMQNAPVTTTDTDTDTQQ